MKSLFYFASRLPIPAAGGREKMILQTLSFFNEYKIVFFLPSHVVSGDDREDELARKLGVFKVVILPSPGVVDFIRNVVFLGRSFQESMFYRKSSEYVIEHEKKLYSPSVVIFDMLRMGTYSEVFPDQLKVLEIDDMLSLRYQRMLSQNYDDFDLLGTYSKFYPKFLTAMINGVFVKPLLWVEKRRIYDSELRAAKKFDFINFVSELEAEHYKSLVSNVEVFAIPPTVSYVKGVKRKEVSYGNVRVLGFIGNLTTNQNLYSLSRIVNEVLPHLDGDYVLSVIGDYDERASKFSNKNSNVLLHGFVDNIEVEVQKIDLMLAPIAFGTGIKLKILDAMSYGVPVLTNDIGAEGILGKSGEHYFIESDYSLIAKKVNDLFSRPEAMKAVGRSGRNLVKELYSPDFNKLKYASYIESKI